MKKDQRKLGVFLSYLTILVQNMTALLYTPFVLRILGKNEYGLYEMVYAVISYLSLLNFGFGSTYIRFYFRYREKEDRSRIANLNGMFLLVFCFLAGVALMAGLVLSRNIEWIFGTAMAGEKIARAGQLLSVMSLNLAFTLLSVVFDSYLIVRQEYLIQRMVLLFQAVFQPLVSIPMLLLGMGSLSIGVAALLISVIRVLILVRQCRKKYRMKISFRQMDFQLFKEIGVFSFYIFINMLVDQLNWSVDKLILGIKRGTEAVAVYAVGSQINTCYLSVSSAVSSVFIPKVNQIVMREKKNRDKELTRLFTKVGRIQFMILMLLATGFILFGQYFMKIWAGQDYAFSYYVAVILVIPVTIPLIQNLGIEIQRARNMHQFRSVLYIVLAGGNVACSIPLASKYGGVGAALGTGICVLIGNGIVMNWYYHAQMKLDMQSFWKSIGKLGMAALPAFLAGIFVTQMVYVDSIGKFLAEGSCYTLLYMLCIYTLGMDAEEKNMVKELFRGIGRLRHYNRG